MADKKNKKKKKERERETETETETERNAVFTQQSEVGATSV